MLGRALRIVAVAVAVALAAPLAGPPAAQAQAAQKRLVVIDAGHGGVDPGARGPAGTLEKDVTLAVARRLAAILREDPTLEVRLTRDSDTLVALRDRPRMANRWRKDGQPALFISIHCNAHSQRAVRGVETYFLSEAKTEDARRVAAMENAAERFEEPRAAEADPLGFIMNDLRQNHYLRESSEWAALVQSRIAPAAPGPDRGVKQAAFVVLDGAFMPAVLVEIGFLSNAEEERVLRDAAHQRRIAAELAAAVQGYFRRTQAASVARGG